MRVFTLFFFVFLISIIHLRGHALNSEGIMNGAIANLSNFQFQVAIISIQINGGNTEMLGSGVIIGSCWILSIAHIFVTYYQVTWNVLFRAIVGSTGTDVLNGVSEDIMYVYIYNFDPHLQKNDLTVAKTRNHFSTLGITFHVIEVSSTDENLVNRDGTVSGYGNPGRIWVNGIETDYNRVTDYKIRTTAVRLASSRICRRRFPFISVDGKVCGVASNNGEQYTGMCSNDVGNPVVMDGKVVALASTYTPSCNDSQIGSLYITLGSYYEFINNAKNDILGDSMSKLRTLNSRFESK